MFRGITWEISHFSSFAQLDKSAKTKCHICQLIWFKLVIEHAEVIHEIDSMLSFKFMKWKSHLDKSWRRAIIVNSPFDSSSAGNYIYVVKGAIDVHQSLHEKSLKMVKRKL